MRIMHVLRSKPDDMVRYFIKEVSGGEESLEVHLYKGDVDFDKFIKDIFESRKVISWW